MEYQHLNEVRNLMSEEAEADIQANSLFISPRLNEVGQMTYAPLLLDAIQHHGDVWLAENLVSRRLLSPYEISHRKGVPYQKAVPRNAHETLAVGEFNRFYMRGVARLALAKGQKEVIVMRGQHSTFRRGRSINLEGAVLSAEEVLADLRFADFKARRLGLGDPNSGLTICLPN